MVVRYDTRSIFLDLLEKTARNPISGTCLEIKDHRARVSLTVLFEQKYLICTFESAKTNLSLDCKTVEVTRIEIVSTLWHIFFSAARFFGPLASN